MQSSKVEGFVNANATDAALFPGQARAFLDAQDAKFPGWDLSFLERTSGPAFMTRMTAPSAAWGADNTIFLNGETTNIDYQRGVSGVSNGLVWSQPANDGPSWWVFGAFLNTAVVTGTPTQSLIVARIYLQDTDPNSPSGNQIAYNQTGSSSVIETNTGGEWVCLVTLAHILNTGAGSAIAEVEWVHHDVPCTKRINAGSFFYGFRVSDG